MIRIAMIGLGGVVLALMFRQQKSEYALYISLGAAVLILILSVEKLGSVVETVRNIQAYIQLDSAMIKILLKMIGITYVSEFAAQICRDAGFGALGSQIEMFARLSIMAVSVPVLLALIETVEGLMGA
ncbi:MAG: stage III sporulation protein AD [Clostridiales bacterium]|nr:stage III sporulation protein AD [Clostridiales bacterium]MCD8132346.1 stage III sporulation protein AD [Clostridiales bacterium]